MTEGVSSFFAASYRPAWAANRAGPAAACALVPRSLSRSDTVPIATLLNPQSGRLSLRTTPAMAASTPPLDPLSSAGGLIEHP